MVVTCSVCEKTFERNKKVNPVTAEAVGRDDRILCYQCALEWITKGYAPEEGDFNSAHLISGEITDQELGWLQQDLEDVEFGRSRFEPEEEAEDAWKDPYWCDVCKTVDPFCEHNLCRKCGEHRGACECGHNDELESDPNSCPICGGDIHWCSCADRYGD